MLSVRVASADREHQVSSAESNFPGTGRLRAAEAVYTTQTYRMDRCFSGTKFGRDLRISEDSRMGIAHAAVENRVAEAAAVA